MIKVNFYFLEVQRQSEYLCWMLHYRFIVSRVNWNFPCFLGQIYGWKLCITNVQKKVAVFLLFFVAFPEFLESIYILPTIWMQCLILLPLPCYSTTLDRSRLLKTCEHFVVRLFSSHPNKSIGPSTIKDHYHIQYY